MAEITYFVGMHHDYKKEILPRINCSADIVGHLTNGAYIIDVYQGGCKIGIKSMFNCEKTQEEVMEMILEALNNPIQKALKKANNYWEIRGRTKSGLDLELLLDAQGKVIGYPLK